MKKEKLEYFDLVERSDDKLEEIVKAAEEKEEKVKQDKRLCDQVEVFTSNIST